MAFGIASAAASVNDERSAKELLDHHLTPKMVRAVALRAEELRFLHSGECVGIARAAAKAFGRLSPEYQDPSLAALTLSIYGSALRSAVRLIEAEAALKTAARFALEADLEAQVEVARRLAYLRAEQRRPKDVHALLPLFLEWGERLGGREYAKELVGAGAILIRIHDFATAARLTEIALTHLPASHDPFYVSATYNLANCRLELALSEADFASGFELVREAAHYIEAGTYLDLRLHWLRGKYLFRQGGLDESLSAMETARVGIDASGDGMDQALLMLDLADLHLLRGDPEAARQLALSSFPTLKLLRTNPEAYRALQTFHRAAQDEALDSAVVATVRDRLDAAP